MNIGDMVKRRNRDWYALVLGFRTDLGTLPCGVELGALPAGCKRYPIIMWIVGDDTEWHGEVDSCSASLLEVVSNYPNSCTQRRAT